LVHPVVRCRLITEKGCLFFNFFVADVACPSGF